MESKLTDPYPPRSTLMLPISLILDRHTLPPPPFTQESHCLLLACCSKLRTSRVGFRSPSLAPQLASAFSVSTGGIADDASREASRQMKVQAQRAFDNIYTQLASCTSSVVRRSRIRPAAHLSDSTHRSPNPTHRSPNPTHRSPDPTHCSPDPTHRLLVFAFVRSTLRLEVMM